MNNLLSLRENMFLKIKDKKSNSLYRCLSIENIEIKEYQYAIRYHLQSEKNYKEAILEVRKDQENNITISLHTLIEKVDFNLQLLSNLGSETIIYKNLNTHKVETKYQIIQNSRQEERYFKYIIHKNEYQYENYKDYYIEDANGNLYSMLKKVTPSQVTSNKKTYLFWEYKNIIDNRLRIEIINPQKEIIFYQTRVLKRYNIKIIYNNSPEYKDYKNKDDLKTKYQTHV